MIIDLRDRHYQDKLLLSVRKKQLPYASGKVLSCTPYKSWVNNVSTT